jgi:8-oxo-dGTP diphosphatase
MGCQNSGPEIRVTTPDELWRRAARGTTAGAVILDELGRVLLVKHSYGPLNWEIPGGAAELDETPTENVLREVREETGLTVIPEQLTGIYYERKGPGFEVLHFAFRCRVGNSAAVPEANSAEITQCGYWPLDELPRPISDFTLRRLRDALEGVPGLLPVRVDERHILT